ncbi:MAG: carbohydrate kinase family protein [Candidatus Bathyarchaeota archaeon]|nr:carbohydrate kinase family protein [Candidatus Bathyarchaeota archaeon]
MTLETFDVAVVGHLCIDTIMLPSRTQPFRVLGGATTYTSFAVKHLCALPAVISKIGEDFPQAYLWWLQQEGINTSAVKISPNEQSTSFQLQYSSDLSERTLTLKGQTSPITIEDLPSNFHSKAIHIAPIAGEVSYEVAEQLKSCADMLSLDPQGILRSFDDKGKVGIKEQVDKKILELINVYKSSIDEITLLTGQTELGRAIKEVHDLGVETVIITMGTKGALLSTQGAQHNIPACQSEVLVDPTGAGDVFIGGFITEYIQKKEPLWCACVGSAAASLVVEGLGPTYFGNPQDIYWRANKIFKKEN